MTVSIWCEEKQLPDNVMGFSLHNHCFYSGRVSLVYSGLALLHGLKHAPMELALVQQRVLSIELRQPAGTIVEQIGDQEHFCMRQT
jgi:hypothetical protein